MNNSSAPRKRASGFQRAAISNALQFAFDDSQLDFAEFTERNNKAIRVTYIDELIPLVADLSLGPGLPDGADVEYLMAVVERFQQPIMPDQLDQIHQPPATPNTPVKKPSQDVISSLLAPGAGGETVIRSLFSEVSKRGHWVCSEETQVLAICGKTVLDLTNAQVASMHTKIEVIGLMGEVEIIVPKAFRITDDIVTFMGSASLKQSRQRVPLDDDAPTITITGAAILSEVKIKQR